VADLLTAAELPDGFAYPAEFLRVVELGLMDLEPWYIFEGDDLRLRVAGLRKRYARSLVPFARRQDNDDIAVWDLDAAGTVAIVHDFASPGWEQRARLGSFRDWLHRAIDDLIEFE
jgi:hypothetical protein